MATPQPAWPGGDPLDEISNLMSTTLSILGNDTPYTVLGGGVDDELVSIPVNATPAASKHPLQDPLTAGLPSPPDTQRRNESFDLDLLGSSATQAATGASGLAKGVSSVLPDTDIPLNGDPLGLRTVHEDGVFTIEPTGTSAGARTGVGKRGVGRWGVACGGRTPQGPHRWWGMRTLVHVRMWVCMHRSSVTDSRMDGCRACSSMTR